MHTAWSKCPHESRESGLGGGEVGEWRRGTRHTGQSAVACSLAFLRTVFQSVGESVSSEQRSNTLCGEESYRTNSQMPQQLKTMVTIRI